MRGDKVEMVNGYLAKKFPMTNIEYKHDFDLDAERFKISFKGETALLKVSGIFLDDNNEEEILRLFDLWDLAGVLAKEKELGVLATSTGLSTFER